MTDQSTKYCAQCGTELPADAKFCASCGATVDADITRDHSDSAPVSPVVAAPEGTSRRGVWITVGGIAVAAVIAAAVFAFIGGGTSGDVALALPNRDGTVDIHLVGLGGETNRDTEVVRDARFSGNAFRTIGPGGSWIQYRDVVDIDGTLYGLYRDEDGTESYIAALQPDGELVGEFDGAGVVASWDPGTSRFYVASGDESLDRCYVAQPGGEAERLARGDSCTWSFDNTQMLLVDGGANGVDLAVVDLEGNELLLFENEEDYSYHYLDAAGEHLTVAFRDDETGRRDAALYRTDDGTRLADVDDFDTVRPVNASGVGASFFFLGRDDGDVEEVLLHADTTGATSELAEADSFSNIYRLNGGSHVAYAAIEEGDSIAYVQDLATGDRLEVADSSTRLSLTVLPDGRLAVAADEGGFYLAEADGSNARRAGRISLALGNVAAWTFGGDDVVFLVQDIEASLTSLYRFDPGTEELVELVDEYHEARSVTVSEDGAWLAFVGREDEGDPTAVFMVPTNGEDRPDELDDDTEGVTSLDFVGQDLIYSVRTGDRSDDYEVRRLRPGVNDPPEVLHEEAYILGIGGATVLTVLNPRL